MEVYRQHSVGPGHRDHIRHQPGRDRHSRLVLLVAAPVSVVGDHRRDAAGRRSPGGVDHDEQLHQVIVDRRRQGLDQEHVPFTYVLLNAHEGVVVGELERLGLAQRYPQVGANVLGEGPVGVQAENLEVLEQRHGVSCSVPV